MAGSNDTFAFQLTGAGSVTPLPPPSGPATFIRLFSLVLTASATSTVTITGSVSGATLGTFYMVAGVPVPLFDEHGVLNVPVGDGLTITSSAGNVGGCGRYAVKGA